MVMHSGGRSRPTSEINITPLVDIVLVLLIIFMVVTPVLRAGYEASVPPCAPHDSRGQVDQLVVRLEADGGLFINSEQIAPGSFAVRLRQVLEGRASQPTFVAAAGMVPYQKVVALMAVCREAGAANLAVVVDELTVR
jgi:biopolymer transport protein ExbD